MLAKTVYRSKTINIALAKTHFLILVFHLISFLCNITKISIYHIPVIISRYLTAHLPMWLKQIAKLAYMNAKGGAKSLENPLKPKIADCGNRKCRIAAGNFLYNAQFTSVISLSVKDIDLLLTSNNV